MKTFPPALAALLAKVPPMPLGPPARVPDIRLELEAVLPALSAGCRAGLLLAFGFWDESHSVAQDSDTREGSYWHAILHRCEPDAGNAKYWFRQVGSHPVLTQLREQCPALGYAFTNPSDFVDFCERAQGTGSPEEELAERVQALEWHLLFEYCHTWVKPSSLVLTG